MKKNTYKIQQGGGGGEAGGGGAEKEKKRNHQKNEGYTYFLHVKCLM